MLYDIPGYFFLKKEHSKNVKWAICFIICAGMPHSTSLIGSRGHDLGRKVTAVKIATLLNAYKHWIIIVHCSADITFNYGGLITTCIPILFVAMDKETSYATKVCDLK